METSVDGNRGAMKRAWLVALAGAGLALAGLHEARAASSSFSVLAMSTGYGVEEDCLAAGGACGRLVADAWCEARGLGAAASFGPSAEGADAGTFAAPNGYVVSCSREAARAGAAGLR